MSLVPVKFNAMNCTIRKADEGKTLQLAPASGPECFTQSSYFADLVATRDQWISSIEPMTSKSSLMRQDYL
jgi:hypothetical protein